RYRIVSQPDEVVSVLENGLTVIARRVASPVLAVRGYVAAGGIHEGRWLGGGLSHLLEHLVAGGTTARRTEAENRALLQKIGNNANAYTTFDHTAYFINTTPEHLGEAVDLLTGWLFGARITEAEFHREYEVVQRELEQGEGQPDRRFFQLALLTRYRQSPIRVPVIGYQEVIQGLTRDDVYAYYRTAYQPNNVVITVAGAHPPESMLDVVRRHVGATAAGREFPRDVPAEPPVLGPRTVVATFPRLGQAILQLAFPTIRLDHPDLYALDLLAAVLSEGESSLLVQEIRDARRLVTAIGASSFTPDFVTGSFEVQMRLDPDRIAAATRAVLDVLARVERDGVAEERVRRAKTQVRVARIARLQTAEAIAASLATDYLSTGDPHFTDRYVERIQAVTAGELRAVARRYFDRSRLLTTAMLPAEHVGARGLPRAEDLIRPVAPAAPPAPPAADAAVTRVELDNETVLLHKRITTSPLVVATMYALGGLTAEDDQTNGLGNLAMTLVPRGTTTRSAAEIAAFFDSIGGGLTAGMGNNTWFWTMTGLREDFEKAFEVFADVVARPAFPADELALARQRILAVIEGQDAEWTDQAFRFFRRAYYGPRDSPYRFVTIGTRDNVAAFTREEVADWYARRVLGSRRVLAVFGDVDRARAKALARAHLG
ncbi:MAG: M16 family metallopeptidase, partial [Candidatus Rokuibacteriota bacterium]